jgi:thiol:disulfide interchange protein DsbD
MSMSRSACGFTIVAGLMSVLRRLLQLAVILLAMPFGQVALAADDYLDPAAAFAFSATMANEKTVAVTYAIADGYYMYRERFQFKAEGATLGAPVFPDGKVKFDETFQKNVETYRHSVTIMVPVEATGAFVLMVTGQGCADLGLCYAPMESQARLSSQGGGLAAALQSSPPVAGMSSAGGTSALGGALPRQDLAPSNAGVGSSVSTASATRTAGTATESVSIETALRSGKLLVITPLFLLLGLGLAFTPCVLPMVPILSAIIVGEGSGITRSRGFLLSLTYALGMAIVYTALGVAAGLVGEGLAATLQNPWVLSAFALLMVVLSLSMFGVYELQVPGAIQAKLAQASRNLRAGKIVGVFLMGALSALIVGPCVAAPLAGALVYISQTRDVVIGGSALFALAIGMSVPLLLVGVSAGTLLPRAGRWMDTVKRFFGVLMLAVALWMISPVIPVAAQMAGWAALGIGYGAYLLWSGSHGWPFKAIGLAAAAFGLLQLVGMATGGRDVLQPLAHLRGAPQKSIAFTRVKSSAQLDAMLASMAGKTVLLDFYADWCVSCKEMEKLTFTDQGIRQQLANTVLLQADVTANDAEDRALLKRFQLFGPPGIILFDRKGQEISGSRIIGYQSPKRFAVSLAPLAPT